MINKKLKGCLIGVASVIGFIIVSITLFFAWFKYSSPVNEAGREYERNVRSFRNETIESMDDVYERIQLLDSHFSSPTFNKVQGGDKTEVTGKDIIDLFGEPDRTVEDSEIDYVVNVYQYEYEDITVNFHKGYLYVREYIIEEYNGDYYDEEMLNQLYIDIINKHQMQFSTDEETYEAIEEEKWAQLLSGETPTRMINQNGWFDWSLNRRHYFDILTMG